MSRERNTGSSLKEVDYSKGLEGAIAEGNVRKVSPHVYMM